jgi:Bacterial capsule synthesis protein PGA_cap
MGRGRIAAAAAVAAGSLAAVIGATSGGGEGDAARKRPPGGPVSLVWGGDVTLGSYRGRPPHHGRTQLAAVARALRRADISVVNLEGTFGPASTAKCAVGASPTCFPFQAPARNAGTLRWAGVDLVNTANNHAYDYGPQGWVATRRALIRAGVAATGAVSEVHVIERNGTRVAFAGFSTYPWTASMSDLASVKALVADADRQAEVVVVLMHSGAEGADRTHVPVGREEAFGEDRGDSRTFAHTAIDTGADLVLGSGPHVLRGMELYKGRLIAYSLGNLTGWHNFGVHGALGLSGLLRVDVAPDGRLRRGRLISLRLRGAGVPRRDRSETARRLVRRLSRADFGPSSAYSP